jgi:hypothetical protein
LYVIESHGEPVAALVPINIAAEWEQERRAFFDDLRATAARVNLTQEEADVLVDEAIQAVRAQARAEPKG